MLQATEMLQANRAFTFASNNEWIFFSKFVTAVTYSADMVSLVPTNVFGSHDLRCFFQFLLVHFLRSLSQLLASQVFDSKLDPTDLHNVELVNFIVVFTIGGLERANHNPQLVNRVLSMISVWVRLN